MLDQMFDTNKYHTQGAHEIAQRIREREAKRWLLQNDYVARAKGSRKSTRKNLAALITSLFGQSL